MTEHSDPTGPRSRQPWLHRLQTAVRGNMTGLCDRSGDITAMRQPGTAAGLYVDDRRILHHLSLRVDDVAPEPVAADSEGPQTVCLLVARNVGDPGADPTVHLERRLTLVEGGADLAVDVHARSMTAVRCVIRLELAGDGAELHEVKSGFVGVATLPVSVDSQENASWRDERHATSVVAVGASVSGEDGVIVAEWPVELAAGGSCRLTTHIRVVRTTPTLFDAGCGVAAVTWDSVRVEAQDARLGRTVHRSLIDLRHLLLTDPDDAGDVFAAAGSPWYLTLFGRDSIWAARMSLPFGTELAAGTLRALARRQGRVENTAAAEQPGKILHEVRRTSFEDPGHLHLPPIYYGSVDATPLWIVLLHDAWRWGLREGEVRALGAPLQAALNWMRCSAEASVDGFLRYADEAGAGLTNQGWKDSGDAMRDATGNVAQGSIALLETQAYAVEAARGAADVLEQILGIPGDPWRGWAGELAARVREAYWVRKQQLPYLAMALDHHGRQVDGVGSNMGHALGTGLLTDAEEHTVALRLSEPDLLGPLGISTLSRDNPAYNPLGYHTGSVWTHDTAICAWGLSRAGHTSSAAAAVRSLVDVAAASSYRWPELYSSEPVLSSPVPYPASCRPQAWAAASAGLLLSTVLGLHADVPNNRLQVAPLKEAPFGAVQVAGLRFAGHPLSIAVDHTGHLLTVDAPVSVKVDDTNNRT